MIFFAWYSIIDLRITFAVKVCSLDTLLGQPVVGGCIDFWYGVVADIKLITVCNKFGVVARKLGSLAVGSPWNFILILLNQRYTFTSILRKNWSWTSLIVCTTFTQIWISNSFSIEVWYLWLIIFHFYQFWWPRIFLLWLASPYITHLILW